MSLYRQKKKKKKKKKTVKNSSPMEWIARLLIGKENVEYNSDIN